MSDHQLALTALAFGLLIIVSHYVYAASLLVKLSQEPENILGNCWNSTFSYMLVWFGGPTMMAASLPFWYLEVLNHTARTVEQLFVIALASLWAGYLLTLPIIRVIVLVAFPGTRFRRWYSLKILYLGESLLDQMHREIQVLRRRARL